MPCEHCFGYKHPSCEYCKGSGWVEQFTCVNSVVEGMPLSTEYYVQAIDALRQHHVLPFSGGWLEQPDDFLEMHRIFSLCESMIAERKRFRGNVLRNMAPKR